MSPRRHAAIGQEVQVSRSWTKDQLVQQSLEVSKVLCFVTMLFSLLTAVGWLFGISLLTQWHPTLPAMQPNTALGLFLGALAVLWTREGATTHWRTTMALFLASAILLLGLLTLSEYTFGWDIGIDRVFVHGAPTASQPFPGRPSPQTSMNFALLGAALLWFNMGFQWFHLGQIAAIVTGANAIVAGTGYVFGTSSFFGFPLDAPAVGMAVHTAIGFVLLVSALFCARPNDGMMTLVTSETRSGGMARRILLSVIVVPPLVGALTRVGVVEGWYDVRAEISLFALGMIGFILRATWLGARRSEHEELMARAAFEALQSANEKLSRTSDERAVFAALIKSSSDFIGIADANGKPVYLNPAGRRMVGLAADYPVENTNIPDYYPPDQRSFVSTVILKSLIDHGHWQGETYFRHWETQEAIPVSYTLYKIHDPETGRVLGMGTITRDTSDIKRAREEIEAGRRRLQQANEELTRLYERAKELDELKTQLFASIGHELRTPLTLILGPIEKRLGSTTGLDADLRQDLEVIERNARTVLRHVNDLLDVARLKAGRLKPDYTEEDAAALVRSVAGHFSVLAKEKNIEFVVEAPSALPVQVDSDKLRRILLNLLSNAFKFTPGDGRVRLSLRGADDRFFVEVGDSGPGIPVDKRDEVFERFRQIETGPTRRFGGTGLGLSIVRDFAGLLAGSISVADAPEGGALLVLDLPCVAPPGTAVGPGVDERANARDVDHLVDELRDRHLAATADRVSEKSLDGLVLVVEDNRDMSRFIIESLMSRGFRVATAFDGRTGYEKAIELRPDLVLTDIMMPVMSGDELLRCLRQKAELSSMPIVVFTAKSDNELRVRLLREGAQDYLEKPFSVEELLARVQNLVARKLADDHNSRLRQQLEDVARASMSVSEAVAGLPETSVRAVLEVLALNARNLTSAEFVAAGIGSDPSRPFDTWVSIGISNDLAKTIGPHPRPVGLLGLVPKEDRTIRTRDLQEHPEFRGFPPHHPDMTSFLGVPIRHGGHAVGSLYLANKRGHAEFTEHDERLVEMLADRAGVAIETAQLFAAEGVRRAWLQAVIDQMPEGIVLMDAEGRVTLKNRSMLSLSAATPEELDRFGNPVTVDLRRPSGERLPPDDLPIIKAIIDKATIQGSEFVARRADGRLIPLLVSAAPILGERGELVGATMIFQDVSTLKELEHLREEWAAVVAHDLQQPISVIVLRSGLLLDEDLTSKQKEDVREVRNAAKRLSRMVNDLMDASQLETRRLRIALDRLDLGELVRGVAQRVPAAAPRTQIRTPVNSRLFVQGDAQRLEQVVTNLLSNAVKYGAPEGEIRLDVRTSDGHAEVLVTNHGPGIPANELSVLFERYVRSRAARTSATTGSGLGLYIARGLVEAHGGRIWAESVPGETTTFHFTIPLDGPPMPIAAWPLPDESRSQPEFKEMP